MINIRDQFLQTLLKLTVFLGAISLISLLWPLMSSIREVINLIQQVVELITFIGKDFFSILVDLTHTLETVYGIWVNIVPMIRQDLRDHPTEIVNGVKKALSFLF
jgi:phage-related protein